MAQGWYGNSEGHRKAGRLGGLKSAATRRRKAAFRERLNSSGEKTSSQSPAQAESSNESRSPTSGRGSS
jgi:DNA-binding LacI/PurR family transcriptional regulator